MRSSGPPGPGAARGWRRLAQKVADADAAHPGVGNSPVFLAWQERILATGTATLDLGEGLAAELEVYANEQQITFRRVGVRSHPVILCPAADPEADPVRAEPEEYYFIRLDTRDSVLADVAVADAVAPVRLFDWRGGWFVEVAEPVVARSRRWHPRILQDGPVLDLSVRTDGELLSVLPVGPKAAPTHVWLDGKAVETAAFGLDRDELGAFIPSLCSMQPPAARALARHLLSGGAYTWDIVDRYRNPDPWSPPEGGVCAVCGQRFEAKPYYEDWAPGLFRSTCWRCLTLARYGDPRIAAMNLERVHGLLNDLARLLGRVPTAQWAAPGLSGYSTGVASQIVVVAAQLPPSGWFTAAFGSWTHALVCAGVLSDATWQVSRGIRSIAADGHLCHSVGERVLDDWLHGLGVPHDREPVYPGSKMRADFDVAGTFVEYFGLAGEPSYDAKTAVKRALAEHAGIRLVEVFPEDLEDWPRTQVWLAQELGLDPAVVTGE